MHLGVPLFNLLTLLYEVEAHPQWVPFCHGGKKVRNEVLRRLIVAISYVLKPIKNL